MSRMHGYGPGNAKVPLDAERSVALRGRAIVLKAPNKMFFVLDWCTFEGFEIK